jgi:anti-sigma regulatory factor (Ser/Thr protein kinase)
VEVEAQTHRRFDPRPESVMGARHFVQEVLGDLSVTTDELHEIAQLLASELASNAVLHARTDFDVGVELPEGADGPIVLSVTDHEPAVPVMRVAPLDSAGGRGIFLVDQLSAGWGVDPKGDGKRVWCRLVDDANVSRSPARV